MTRFALRPMTFLTLLALGAPALTGCMLTRPDSGPAFQAVQDHLVPENRTAQYLLLPVFIPVGAAAAITDAAVIHPVMIIGDTAEDTGDMLWDNMKWDEQYMTESAALPWRAVATPVFFSGMWVGRVLFEIPREAQREIAEDPTEYAELGKRQTEVMTEARELMDNDRAEEALKLLIENQEINWANPREEQQAYVLMIFRAALESGRYEIFEEFAHGPYFQVRQSKGFAELLDRMIASDNPYARAVAYGWQADSAVRARGHQAARDVLHQMLNDESEAVRSLGLLRFRPWTWSRESLGPELLADLEEIKANDPSAYNREKAAAVMRQLLEEEEAPRGPRKPVPPRAQ